MEKLLAEVRAEVRAGKASELRRERIKALLIQVRLENPDLKVVDLERDLGGFYDRATISRITYPAIKDAASGQS
jgi:hypothetical protein